MSPASTTIVGLAGLAVLAIGLGQLMRHARCPGWAVIGGLMAGILLGPSVMGRVLPDTHERWFVGGQDERVVLTQFERQQIAERLVAEEVGQSRTEIDARDTENAEERSGLERDLAEARRRDTAWPRWVIIAAVGVVLAIGARRRSATTGPGPGVIAPLSIGLWSALLPGGLSAALAFIWFHVSPAEAAALGAALAIGPWMLSEDDRRTSDDAEIGGGRLLEHAGRVATIIGIGAMILAVALRRGEAFSPALGAGETIAVVTALGVAPAAMIVAYLRRRTPPIGRADPIAMTTALLVPLLAASVAVRIDLFIHGRAWLIVLILLASGDGRWLGATIGTGLLGGRSTLTILRLVNGAMAAGPTQLALTALACTLDLITPAFALALLLGVALIELSAPLRRSMATELARAQRDADPTSDNFDETE